MSAAGTMLDAEGALQAGKEDGAVAMKAIEAMIEKGFLAPGYRIHAYTCIVSALRDRRIEKGEMRP